VHLYRLCLVNKLFNALFSPILYRELKLQGNRARLKPALTSSRSHLAHVRSLVLESCGGEDPVKSNAIVSQMLPKMPRLETFT
jgi:hypothetical protein